LGDVPFAVELGEQRRWALLLRNLLMSVKGLGVVAQAGHEDREASLALDAVEVGAGGLHAGGRARAASTPAAAQRRDMSADRQRFTLRVTFRTAPITFSMASVTEKRTSAAPAAA
jgi:hypothetical protein